MTTTLNNSWTDFYVRMAYREAERYEARLNFDEFTQFSKHMDVIIPKLIDDFNHGIIPNSRQMECPL